MREAHYILFFLEFACNSWYFNINWEIYFCFMYGNILFLYFGIEVDQGAFKSTFTGSHPNA